MQSYAFHCRQLILLPRPYLVFASLRNAEAAIDWDRLEYEPNNYYVHATLGAWTFCRTAQKRRQRSFSLLAKAEFESALAMAIRAGTANAVNPGTPDIAAAPFGKAR
jgi:hypothetical protein